MKPQTFSKLEVLNTYRKACGLDPIAAWRQARHQPMLDQYEAAAQQQIEREGAEQSGPLKDAVAFHDFASAAISEAAKATKIPPYKTFARYTKSSVDSPCGFVHQFLTEHPDLTRKQAMFALAQYGVNYSTARTQYQKWFAGHPSAALAARLGRDNKGE